MDNLSQFCSRIHTLYRLVSLGGRRATQADLAAAVGLSRTELNRRLHQAGQLTCRDGQAIVRQLAGWGAITTRAEAAELLDLLDCASFTPAEWQAEPLDRLTANLVAPLSSPLAPGNLPAPLTSTIFAP